MKIEFYEEFPNKENLQKLKLIKFKTRLFIAAKSINKFKEFGKQAKNLKKDIEVAYWPTIKGSYWISPLSDTRELIKLFNELSKIKNHILIDLEFPLIKNWKLYIKNIFQFVKNKRLIKKFLEKNKNRITTAEYVRSPLLKETKFLGLDYNIGTEKSLMYYTSMSGKNLDSWKEKIFQIKNKKNYSLSLGTIATGILGNEKILSPENLRKDLEFAKKSGFDKVIIFRLEGLNEDYLKIINKFI